MTARCRYGFLMIGCAVLLAAASPARAASVWLGDGADDLWSTTDNWDVAPDPSAVGDLTFTGTQRLTPVADDQPWSGIETLLFDSDAGAFEISGERLEFDTGSILSESDERQIIENAIAAFGASLTLDGGDEGLLLTGPIDLDDNVTLDVNGGEVQISDTITGDADLFVGGESHLILDSENAFTGGTTLEADSRLTLGDDHSLGAGDLTVTGAGYAELAGQENLDDLILENAITVDALQSILRLTGDVDITLDGDIDGPGGIAIDTRVLLTGENTYGGDTRFESGRAIAGSEDAFGAGQIIVEGDTELRGRLQDGEGLDARTVGNDIAIEDEQVLSIRGETSLILDGVISGDGGLRVNFAEEDGEGEEIEPILSLNQANTYTGGTELIAGRIEVGDDQAFGTGEISVDGRAWLTADEERVIDNDIFIAQAQQTRVLIVEGEHDWEFTGELDGHGVFDIGLDDATITFSGNSEDYSGTVRIFDGSTMDLTGTMGGAVFIQGLMVGEGTVAGDVRVFEDGVLSPGASIGTMTIEGDYTQHAGSTLEIEIDVSTGDADKLLVGGDVLLEQDSRIDVVQVDNDTLQLGDTFDIIEAEGDITDEGTSVLFEDEDDVLLRLIGQILEDNGTNIYQLIATEEVFDFLAEGANNLAVAQALNTLNVAGAPQDVRQFLSNLAGIETATEYNQALQDLSPERYHAVDLLTFDNARLYNSNVRSYLAARRQGGPLLAQRAMIERSPVGQSLDDRDYDGILSLSLDEDGERVLGDPVGRPQQRSGFGDDGRWGLFGQAFGGYHDSDADTYRTGYRASVAGGQFGVDRDLNEQLTVGLGFAYARSDVDFRRGRGDFDVDTFRVGPFLGWSDRRNRWFVDASATWGYHRVDARREIPHEDLTASARYDAHDALLYAGTGYAIPLGQYTLTPRASVQYLFLRHDGFAESGAGPANLRVQGRDAHSLRPRLGASLSRHFDVAGMVLLPELSAGYEYEALGDNDISAAFAAGGDRFTVSPTTPGRHSATFGASLDLLIRENLTAFLRYEGRAGEDAMIHGFGGGASIRF